MQRKHSAAAHVELDNMLVARKSIVAARDIAKGELITKENLTTKRPGTGLSPMRWDDVVGTVVKRDFVEDDIVVI